MKQHQTLRRWLWCAGAAAVLLLVCSKSSPLYPLNDWMDANIFFTVGKSMMNGLAPYRDVFDHKGPVLYLLYGLGWGLDHTGFFGVWLLEIAAVTVFLEASLRAVRCCTGPLHPAWAVIPAAALLASPMFAHGGSAEEFLLPFLALALAAALQVLAGEAPLPRGAVLAQGFLAGCALWLKYTAAGFYLAWAAVAALCYWRRGWRRELGRSCLLWLGGAVLATLPWLAWFAANGALDALFEVYFYDNLFLYAGQGGGGPLALLRKLWWCAHDNPLPVLLMLLAPLWALAAHRKALLAALAALMAGLAATAMAGEGYLVYYGLVLGVFTPLGLVPLVRAWRNCAPRPALRRVAPWLGAVLAAALCLLGSANAKLLGRPAEELPQLRFAAQINAGPDASLLNYGTLDGGFYTATGLLPPCRFFCVTNMPLPAQQEQQDALLGDGAVTWVVTLDPELAQRFPAYELADAATYDSGEGPRSWYLYRRIG